MKNIIRKVSIIMACICIIGVLNGCSEDTIDPNKYSSYICYDYHLKCLEPEEKK